MAPTFDPDHPRPTLQRHGWDVLDGAWDFHLDRDGAFAHPDDVTWDATIMVPFAPETAASGIGAAGYIRRVWYRRAVAVHPADGGRILLHFGAVDRVATVWADGETVGHHIGGFTPFTVDITSEMQRAHERGAAAITVVVRADDDPHDLSVPRGKQDWEPEPHEIFYPRTTGIWQRVWVERVPALHVARATWQCDASTLHLEVQVDVCPTGEPLVATGEPRAEVGQPLAATEEHWVEVSLHRWPSALDQPMDRPLLRQRVVLRPGRSEQVVRCTFEPAADTPELADALRWWSHDPNLLGASITIVDASGTVIDDTATYTGLRTVGVDAGRITLNGYAIPLRFALDQGYWPDSGMTAPDDDALRRDVDLALSLGLNGVRKHQKIEDPRFLFWADRRGLLVWEEQPSAFRHGRATVAALTREWAEAVERDRNHPSIIAWVPLNESWGVALAAAEHRDQPRHRATIEALAAFTRALDPSRLVIANDGWETVGGDVVGVHDYTNDAERFEQRYATPEAVDETLQRRRPSGRRLTLDGDGAGGRAVVVSEFGGLTLAPATDGLFSYGNTTSTDELLDCYGALCRVLNGSRGIAGWCWTQLTDTFQEANGLVHMDRTPKAPLLDLRLATYGMRSAAPERSTAPQRPQVPEVDSTGASGIDDIHLVDPARTDPARTDPARVDP